MSLLCRVSEPVHDKVLEQCGYVKSNFACHALKVLSRA